MKDYRFKANISWLERKRNSLLKKLAVSEPFIDGSVVKVSRRCGNKNCKCAVRGEKHESFYLQYQEKGATKGIYIPVDFEEEVFKWSKEWKKVKEIVHEICRIQKSIIRRHVKEKRLKKGRK